MTLLASEFAVLAQFVAPVMAGAALAIASIPVVIHLLNRRRFKRVVWAAMDFLLAANRKNARRVQVEQWLLLAVRTLALLLLGLAFARPYLPGDNVMAGLGQLSRVHAIVLDASLSMHQPGAVSGKTAFDVARDRALALVASAPSADRFGVVVAARGVTPAVLAPTRDRDAIAQALAGVQPTSTDVDWPATLDAVTAVLDQAQAAPGNTLVHILTDASGAAFDPQQPVGGLQDVLQRLADRGTLSVIATAGEAAENVAITGVRTRSPLVAAGRQVEVEIEVANLGRRESTRAAVQLRKLSPLTGAQPAGLVQVGTLGAGQRQTLVASITPDTPGPLVLEAELVNAAGDALAADNLRRLAMVVRERVPVLLVDGRPGETLWQGSAGYLYAALAPRDDPTQRTLIEPKIVSDIELPGEALNDYAAIYLSNVRFLEAQQWQRLADYARAGGAVVVALGPQVNIDHYNRDAYANGQGVLALPLVRLMEADAVLREEPRYWTLSLGNASHPVVADFVTHRTGGLFTARVERYIRVQSPGADAPADATVLLAYSNGDAALVLRPLGAGQLVLWTTSASPGGYEQRWNNLPNKTADWVSLNQNMIMQVVQSLGRGRTITAAEPIVADVAGPTADVIGPAGNVVGAELLTDGRMQLRVNTAGELGIYTVRTGGEPMLVAVNPDPAESVLSSTLPAVFAEAWRIPLLAADEFATVNDDGSRELALQILYIVLTLLLIETFLAQRFDHHAG